MKKLVLLLLMFAMPSLFAYPGEQEDWRRRRGLSAANIFLSRADFQLAQMLSYDEIEDTSAPFEDPESQHTYYEGDMMIKEDDEQKVAMYSAKRWPNGRIPYIMENKFSAEERAAIARGIMTLQDRTCIRFVPKKESDKDYVWMRRGPGCAAHVGRIGGQQWLFLGKGCYSVETVVHELMHSVGFIHEQSRPDRDAHVTIMWDNIKDAAKRNFRKHTTDYLADHGFPYDLMSVMHYRQYAFSKNKKATIVAKRPVPYLRCRGHECPSDLDVRKINYLYKCKNGKSGFYGPGSGGGADDYWPSKSGDGMGDGGNKFNPGSNELDSQVMIGENFYENIPFPPAVAAPVVAGMGDGPAGPAGPDGPPGGPGLGYHFDDHSDSDYEDSSEEPCFGEHCYQNYDPDIDDQAGGGGAGGGGGHVPYESRESAVRLVPQFIDQNYIFFSEVNHWQ